MQPRIFKGEVPAPIEQSPALACHLRPWMQRRTHRLRISSHAQLSFARRGGAVKPPPHTLKGVSTGRPGKPLITSTGFLAAEGLGNPERPKVLPHTH